MKLPLQVIFALCCYVGAHAEGNSSYAQYETHLRKSYEIEFEYPLAPAMDCADNCKARRQKLVDFCAVRTPAGATFVAIEAGFGTQTTTTTVTKTVQNPDGTYTIIEYPAKKEITVNLTPVNMTGAKGVAIILRDDDGTRIRLYVTDVPADVTALTLYAVDDKGVPLSGQSQFQMEQAHSPRLPHSPGSC